MDELLDTKGANPNPQPNYVNGSLPNSAAILVLGIISIATSCLYGVPGLVCGIIALSLFKRTKQIYEGNPALYEYSFKNARAGQICAIIGVCLSGLYVLILIVAVLIGIAGSRF